MANPQGGPQHVGQHSQGSPRQAGHLADDTSRVGRDADENPQTQSAPRPVRPRPQAGVQSPQRQLDPVVQHGLGEWGMVVVWPLIQALARKGKPFVLAFIKELIAESDAQEQQGESVPTS